MRPRQSGWAPAPHITKTQPPGPSVCCEMWRIAIASFRGDEGRSEDEVRGRGGLGQSTCGPGSRWDAALGQSATVGEEGSTGHGTRAHDPGQAEGGWEAPSVSFRQYVRGFRRQVMLPAPLVAAGRRAPFSSSPRALVPRHVSSPPSLLYSTLLPVLGSSSPSPMIKQPPLLLILSIL